MQRKISPSLIFRHFSHSPSSKGMCFLFFYFIGFLHKIFDARVHEKTTSIFLKKAKLPFFGQSKISWSFLCFSSPDPPSKQLNLIVRSYCLISQGDSSMLISIQTPNYSFTTIQIGMLIITRFLENEYEYLLFKEKKKIGSKQY